MPHPHLLFISHDSGRSGAPIGLLSFLQWLRTHSSLSFQILLRSPGPLEAAFRDLAPTTTLGTSPLLHSPLGRRFLHHLPHSFHPDSQKIRQLLASNRFNLIYSNTFTNGALLQSLAPLQLPVITHVHELAYWISRAGPQNLQQVLAHSSSFIAASHAVKDYLSQSLHIPTPKISVVYEHLRALPPIPSPTDKITARSLLHLPPNALVIGACGTEHWRKGRDLIPQLLLALRSQRPDLPIHFLWIGRPGSPTEEAQLHHDLSSAQLSHCFHSTGEVENPFLYYPALDAFALLSRDDPFPIACLEVAASKIPIVCFANAGGIPELLTPHAGLVAPYLDLHSFASHLLTLLTQPLLAQSIASHAHAKVSTENTLDSTGPQLLALIEKALHTPSP